MKELMSWKLLHSKLVFDHRWYKVRQDAVELPNGAIVDDYFLSVRPDVALVFPVTAKREIVFVRQYRHGAGKVLVELPAGTFDPQKESAESAALRELQEETGYHASHLTQLATLYDNPVKETNKIHLFLAKNVELVSAQNLDQTEEIEVLLIPIDAVQEKLVQGKISVSGTVAAVFLGLWALQS
ncbi:MAG: NUDIX hydrolase [Leptolyngbyaceae cyanobacterium RM2_2_4]|nr:NUDIX hydrolase [Leptolyngbyaceae cyanobacterium SM1_4_3]NJO49135.1 NUDIX hydrolase [Leptolyngbyaceae cyanobacterium RM2_2_4]NJO66516.1 NUDIX hydrolase [Leptolyngbyaceae cyanobacterium RM1_405_57]